MIHRRIQWYKKLNIIVPKHFRSLLQLFLLKSALRTIPAMGHFPLSEHSDLFLQLYYLAEVEKKQLGNVSYHNAMRSRYDEEWAIEKGNVDQRHLPPI